jgi:FkbM family methyltransferase
MNFNILNVRKFLSKESGIILQSELERLKLLDRYVYTSTSMYNKKFDIVDACTFLSSYYEIFIDNIYKFYTNEKQLTIIDCGANIGLASLFFKKMYPNSEVLAFEPDPNICNVLEKNMLNQGFENVIIRNEAISNEDSIVNFYLEGGHSGMIVNQESPTDKVIPIKSTRLKNLLISYDKIDFLKIDIEGYERYVIPDIADELKKVQFMFLEYHSLLGNDQSLPDILNIIKNAGMRFYLKESYDKKIPFINREIFLNMDLLLNIFCYRD